MWRHASVSLLDMLENNKKRYHFHFQHCTVLIITVCNDSWLEGVLVGLTVWMYLLPCCYWLLASHYHRSLLKIEYLHVKNASENISKHWNYPMLFNILVVNNRKTAFKYLNHSLSNHSVSGSLLCHSYNKQNFFLSSSTSNLFLLTNTTMIHSCTVT